MMWISRLSRRVTPGKADRIPVDRSKGSAKHLPILTLALRREMRADRQIVSFRKEGSVRRFPATNRQYTIRGGGGWHTCCRNGRSMPQGRAQFRFCSGLAERSALREPRSSRRLIDSSSPARQGCVFRGSKQRGYRMRDRAFVTKERCVSSPGGDASASVRVDIP